MTINRRARIDISQLTDNLQWFTDYIFGNPQVGYAGAEAVFLGMNHQTTGLEPDNHIKLNDLIDNMFGCANVGSQTSWITHHPRKINEEIHRWEDRIDNLSLSLSPLSFHDHNLYTAAKNAKRHIQKGFLIFAPGCLPNYALSELIFDSLAYACHMMGPSSNALSYRDHLVHPVVVSALGWWLMNTTFEDNTKTMLDLAADQMLDRVVKIRERISANANAYPIEVKWDTAYTLLTSPESRTCFVKMVWLIASIWHDVGRQIECFATLNASNEDITTSKLPAGCSTSPFFLSYACESSLMWSQEEQSRVPVSKSRALLQTERDRNYFLHIFAKTVMDPEKKDLWKHVADRLNGGIKDECTGPFNKALMDQPTYSDKSISKDKLAKDHAILSALELVTLSHRLGMAGQPIHSPPSSISDRRQEYLAVSAALELAAGPVLTHHTPIEKLEDFCGNDCLAVLLVLADHVHGISRPFVSAISHIENQGSCSPESATKPLTVRQKAKRGNHTNRRRQSDMENANMVLGFHLEDTLDKLAFEVDKCDSRIIIRKTSRLEKALEQLPWSDEKKANAVADEKKNDDELHNWFREKDRLPFDVILSCHPSDNSAK